MIEVEARSFITREKYDELLEYFKKEAGPGEYDYQITYYFTGPHDLRIQKNKNFSKVWLKKGEIHDSHREEIEVKFDREDFFLLEKIFRELGYEIDVVWHRKRNKFSWNHMTVTVDWTKGYGYIIELERLTEIEEEKDVIYEELMEKMRVLGVDVTPKEVFREKFDDYKKNWKTILSQ